MGEKRSVVIKKDKKCCQGIYLKHNHIHRELCVRKSFEKLIKRYLLAGSSIRNISALVQDVIIIILGGESGERLMLSKTFGI